MVKNKFQGLKRHDSPVLRICLTQLSKFWFNYTKDIVVSDGAVVDARAYGSAFNDTTLTAAIAAIAANNQTLLIVPGTWSIAGDLTIPANVCLRVMDSSVRV